MSANIIKMSEFKQRVIVLQLDELTEYKGVQTLAKLIRHWGTEDRKNNTYKLLARKANLTTKTVSRLASGETHTPRWNTCIALYKAIGFNAVRFEQ